MRSLKDPTTGWLYKQEMSFCGKPTCKKCAKGEGHGPYWYAYRWEEGKTKKKYIGKHLPSGLTEDLHKTDILTEDLTEDTTNTEESYVSTDEALHKTGGLTEDLHKTPQLCPFCAKWLGEDLAELVGLSGLIAHRRCIADLAGRVIPDHLTKGERPKSGEIADEMGINSAVLGRLLTKHGYPKPINTTRGTGPERMAGRFYTVDQIPEIDRAVHVLAGELGGGDVLP